jgi:hypothetical protein
MLLALKKNFYVLEKHADEENKYLVQSKLEHEENVHFEVFNSHNILALTDESHKTVSFFSLTNTLNWLKKVGQMPPPLR